ncbi:hypothetical protein QJS66_21980 [Kocuria rhizophila]|nr:hypothetical protein QJS66_21980 [Kocuria rhizophila]
MELDGLISEGKINYSLLNKVLGFVVEGEGTPAEIVEARGLAAVSDYGARSPPPWTTPWRRCLDVVEKIKGGKVQAVGAGSAPSTKAGRAVRRMLVARRGMILEKLGVQGHVSRFSVGHGRSPPTGSRAVAVSRAPHILGATGVDRAGGVRCSEADPRMRGHREPPAGGARTPSGRGRPRGSGAQVSPCGPR